MQYPSINNNISIYVEDSAVYSNDKDSDIYLINPSDYLSIYLEDSAVYSSGEDSEYSDIEDVEDCKMVLVVRNDLKMGKGKVRN